MTREEFQIFDQILDDDEEKTLDEILLDEWKEENRNRLKDEKFFEEMENKHIRIKKLIEENISPLFGETVREWFLHQMKDFITVAYTGDPQYAVRGNELSEWIDDLYKSYKDQDCDGGGSYFIITKHLNIMHVFDLERQDDGTIKKVFPTFETNFQLSEKKYIKKLM